jgi:uncharacterized protein (UPF0332 family)
VPDDSHADIPQTDIDREYSTAEQMLADATKATEVGISKATIVNRLYYACFHAAQAALYARGCDPQSHGRVKTLLGRELIQNGDVPREFGRFLNDMETYRRRVDYGSGGVERDTADLIQQTTAFLEAMGQSIDADASN